MINEKLWSWWFAKQGLDGSLAGASPKAVLEKSGWARTVGGSNPYIALFARAGIGKAQAEQSVADLQIHELPSARGCTYLIPKSDYALALIAAQGTGSKPGLSGVEKSLGVTEEELDRLMAMVLDALAKGALDSRGLRQSLGGAVRSLGDEGKKKGVVSTLPSALGRLQAVGKIRRVPVDGRLDHERYAYALWRPSPLDGSSLTFDEAMAELAKKYFRWIGPATAKQFQAFAGIGVKATQSALDAIGLMPIEPGSDYLICGDELDDFKAHRPPSKPQYSLVSSLDSIVLLRRDSASVVAQEDAGREVYGEKTTTSVGGLQDLPSHGIFDRGRLIGLWEFDPSVGKIERTLFVPEDAVLKAKIVEMERFVRDEIGDARSFSLDSPASREPRLAALRS
ncbi:MAG: winged helix DNA-binding domain-containing protein [Armatimonadetes bacterium]|nr:winged helix DNA-binding domain-containing protein [Armatimonadota bacterium]